MPPNTRSAHSDKWARVRASLLTSHRLMKINRGELRVPSAILFPFIHCLLSWLIEGDECIKGILSERERV